MTVLERNLPVPEGHERAKRIREHLDRHGASLAEVVAAIDDVFISHALETAGVLAAEGCAEYAGHIAAQLMVVLEALEWVPIERLQRHAGKFAGPDLLSAARWHGARLTDLLA
ncbi:hypothetical protein LAZ29_05120 [Cereibacter sphaeroides]|uniref:hypothetical protein n=1 Tax=Cereibacter sphaeroides TaxID=1063 RepID=UPI001F2999C5|nr:hypothetical protein [Cereibacter sphaeroides]MCE6950298.1 hypothetical protein [Cereibacter sphaeroides]